MRAKRLGTCLILAGLSAAGLDPAAFAGPTPMLTPDALALVGLRELTRFRAEVVRDRTAAVNRLHAALDQAFPEFLHVFLANDPAGSGRNGRAR